MEQYIPGSTAADNEPGQYEIWKNGRMVSCVQATPIMAAIWRLNAE